MDKIGTYSLSLYDNEGCILKEFLFDNIADAIAFIHEKNYAIGVVLYVHIVGDKDDYWLPIYQKNMGEHKRPVCSEIYVGHDGELYMTDDDPSWGNIEPYACM